ncbi:response regulator [soil metagenome]
MNTPLQIVNILLVEDNPGDVRLTEEAFKLAKNANKLYIAKDGIEALAFLNHEGTFINVPRPDLILLDLNLPRMDGRELLARIKKDKELRTIPVIILSTSEADTDILSCYNFHANCYIKKPMDFDKFSEIVHHIEYFWLSIVRLPN